MSLKYALLTMLARESFSGYDLITHIDGCGRHPRPAAPPQMYRELNKLWKEQLVSDELVVQTGRPNKRVYSLTSKGQRELLAWVASPAARYAGVVGQGRRTEGGGRRGVGQGVGRACR